MRQEKQLLLDEIQEKLDQSSAFVFTRYESLKPDLSSDFRMQLANAGGKFAVVKKRILIKAAEKEGITLAEEDLKGHIGVAFAMDDPVPLTKAVFDFAKDNKDTLEVLGGQFEGKLCSAGDMKAIAELPSKDELRSQFLGLLEAPMSQTLSVMEALLTSIMHCLENKSQTGEE